MVNVDKRVKFFQFGELLIKGADNEIVNIFFVIGGIFIAVAAEDLIAFDIEERFCEDFHFVDVLEVAVVGNLGTFAVVQLVGFEDLAQFCSDGSFLF